MIIRAATIDDIPLIKDLMDATFGKYGKLEERLQKWITHPDFSVQVAIQNGKLLGICTWHLKTDNDFSRFESFGADAIRFMKDKKIAGVLNLAMAPDWRRKGLGTRLALASVDWLQKQNCDVIIGSSWVNGTDESSATLFRKAGFQALGESTEFLRLQMQDGAECAVCKTPDCRCLSILFGMTYAEFKKNSNVLANSATR